MNVKNNNKGRLILKYIEMLVLALVSIGIICGLIRAESKREILSQVQLETNDKKEMVTEENPAGQADNEMDINNEVCADDARVVSERVNSLVKNEVSYPVRDDGKKVVYLTFDDGPSPSTTPKILDILDQYNVKATFMILGSNLESKESAELLKKEYSSGHAIGNHTYCHEYGYLYPDNVISVDNFIADIKKCDEKLKEVLGEDFSTRVIRFPGGYWSWEGRTAIKPVLQEKGYQDIYWDAMNGDAEGGKKDKDQLVAKAKQSIDECGPNADSVVILMHDIKEGTVQALPEIIEYCESKGFEFRTIK